MAIIGKKITDLPEVTTISDTSYLLVSTDTNTNRISTSTLVRNISGIRNGTNLSSGLGIFKDKTGDTMNFNSLTANDGINISLSSNLIKLNIPNNTLSINKLDTDFKTLFWDLTAKVQTLVTSSAVANNENVGMVAAFASNIAPTGWLICNGDIINTIGTVQGVDAATKLQTLRLFLSNRFGSTGALPDLRGIFIRGLDLGRGVDPGRLAGTYQADTAKIKDFSASIKGQTANTETLPTVNSTNNLIDMVPKTPIAKNTSSATTTTYSFKIDNSNTTNIQPTETKPKNIALIYCIKY